MTYTVNEKKSLIADLILMALVDKELRTEEIAFIKSVGKRMDVGEKELVEMISKPEQLVVETPKDFTKRIIHFHRLMLMMHIDGNVDHKELQLLNEIALKYGFRKTIVDSLLATMAKYPHGEIPPSELLQIHTSSSN
jgi:uncharacterized tellurite resistance protein B-like protein